MHKQFQFVTHSRSKNLIDIKMYTNEESLAPIKHLNLGFGACKTGGQQLCGSFNLC